MATTIIGPESTQIPFSSQSTLISMRAAIGDEWQAMPELDLEHATAETCGQGGAGEMIFSRRYGMVKHPWEADFSSKEPIDIIGWWARLEVIDQDSGRSRVWEGKVFTEQREVHGSSLGPSGIQRWTAAEPMAILDRISVSTSWWADDANNLSEIGWCPDFNKRDHQGVAVGNRTEEMPDDRSYVFGGTDLWTRRDMVEYLLQRYVGESWKITGQDEILDQVSDTVEIPHGATVGRILAHIIPRKLGIDFVIRATEDGYFELQVFSLLGKAYSFGETSIPVNPNLVQFEAGQALDNPLTVMVRTREHSYSRIRILGARILVCCTLRGDDGSLVPRWSPSLEAAYRQGVLKQNENGDLVPDTDAGAEDQDRFRASSRFEPVFQQFGPPNDWDFQGGEAAPATSPDGDLDPGAGTTILGAKQRKIRETEDHLPMLEGWDYSTDPPTDETLEGVEPSLVRPMAWVYEEEVEVLGYRSNDGWIWYVEDLEGMTQQEKEQRGLTGSDLTKNFEIVWKGRYVLAETVSIHVGAPARDIGTFLNCSPNHVLALNHFDPGSDALNAESMHQPKFDYEKIVATIAYRSDERLKLEYQVPGLEGVTEEGSIDVVDESLQLWYMAPSTVLRVDESTGEFVTSGPQGRVLRNDASRAALLMAGAVARYVEERVRAIVHVKGFMPATDLLGQIVSYVQEGGDLYTVQAPITSVEYKGGEKPSTVIKAGFAHL